MKSFFVFERGNREWWKDGLRKEWKDFRELSWLSHCALCRFLTFYSGLPTTLPGGICYASIRDEETEAQRDKAMCTVSYWKKWENKASSLILTPNALLFNTCNAS